MLEENGLNIRTQREKSYQNDELFFLGFENVLKMQTSVIGTRVHNKHSEQCILYRGSVTWNQLLLDLRQETYKCYKIRLKRWLLRN